MLFCRLAFACVCLVIFSGAQVQGQGLEQAERLLLAENPAAARRAAQEIAPATQEEEIQRLWIMALSHMRENAPRAALPYLERLVTLAPETARFRLELGRALYLIEDDTRAGYHFQSALGGVLSFSDIAAVQEYLQAIEQRKLWQGQARVALMRQSNPAQRSGDDALNIVGNLALPLPPVEAATGIEVALGGTYLPPLARDLRARAHVMATGQLFGDKALDRGHLRLEFGLLALGDHGRQIGGGIALQGAFDRDGRLMHGAGLYASFQQSYGRKTHVSLRAGVDRLRYRGVPQMDGLRMTGFAEIAHILSPQLRVQGGAALGAAYCPRRPSSPQHGHAVAERAICLSRGADWRVGNPAWPKPCSTSQPLAAAIWARAQQPLWPYRTSDAPRLHAARLCARSCAGIRGANQQCACKCV